MRKHAYVENAKDAIRSDPSCGFNCEPVPEEDSQFNIFFLSHCCSAKIVTEDGSDWTAEIVEGNPEP
jgi:hypothetical protein